MGEDGNEAKKGYRRLQEAMALYLDTWHRQTLAIAAKKDAITMVIPPTVMQTQIAAICAMIEWHTQG